MIALAAALLAAPTLWLSVPAGAGCRVEEFVAAVVGRRPDLAVRAGSEPGAGDAAAAIDVEERGWRLTVKRAGMEPLHRSLPPPGADCVATSSTAALMIDRALEDLHWNGAAVRIEPMAREAAPGADERAPVPPAVPREPLPVEARIALGAGAATEFGSVLPALSLELGAQLGPWSIGAGATGSLAAHAAVGGVSTVGRYTAVPIDLQLIAGRRFSLGPGWLRLEFAPGLELALASATGALLQHESSGLSTGLLLAARGGYELPLPARFALVLVAEGRVFPVPISFDVEGYPGTFGSSYFGARLALYVSRNFF